ncbi:MAG: GNAT family N-acetyltransferase [Anaerolineae bacterium]|nr:GNAT family N-acetyltransferase [Anaerolineae bacterium]
MSEGFVLVEPATRYRKAFIAMLDDYRRASEDRYGHLRGLTPLKFRAYVRQLTDASTGLGLQPGWVPYTTLWLVRPDVPLIFGSVQLRHWLTESLQKEGGHIGYTITPSQRRKGYGTIQLALALDEVRRRHESLGLDRVLVTCDTDNIGSARVIQSNGGVFESEVISDFSGKPVSRYWIDL